MRLMTGAVFLYTALATLGLGATAAQQVYNSAGWRVECSPSAAAKLMDCQALAQVVQRQNNQVFVSVTVRVPAETKKPVMLIQIPLGMLVSSGVNVTVGAAAPQSYPIQTCTPAGCFVGAPVSAAMIEQMLSSQQIRVAFQNLNKQTVTVSIPLTGFKAAYDKIK